MENGKWKIDNEKLTWFKIRKIIFTIAAIQGVPAGRPYRRQNGRGDPLGRPKSVKINLSRMNRAEKLIIINYPLSIKLQ